MHVWLLALSLHRTNERKLIPNLTIPQTTLHSHHSSPKLPSDVMHQLQTVRDSLRGPGANGDYDDGEDDEEEQGQEHRIAGTTSVAAIVAAPVAAAAAATAEQDAASSPEKKRKKKKQKKDDKA
jgi:hypothetical protein